MLGIRQHVNHRKHHATGHAEKTQHKGRLCSLFAQERGRSARRKWVTLPSPAFRALSEEASQEEEWQAPITYCFFYFLPLFLSLFCFSFLFINRPWMALLWYHKQTKAAKLTKGNILLTANWVFNVLCCVTSYNDSILC